MLRGPVHDAGQCAACDPTRCRWTSRQQILDAAIRAPSGGNTQNWRFLLVDDKATIARLAPLYRHAITELWDTVYAERLSAARAQPDTPESRQFLKVQASADWLADHFAEVPLFLFAFVQATRREGRSIRRCGARSWRPGPTGSAAP